MNKVYYLHTCSTCQRILKELNLPASFEKQNIKDTAITEKQLDEMAQLAGSYESLFSRKAMKFRALDLHNQTLTEQDYRTYMLQEYTFLKRPVFIIGREIFIGNAKNTVAAVQQKLATL